jgi:hypothetical protein
LTRFVGREVLYLDFQRVDIEANRHVELKCRIAASAAGTMPVVGSTEPPSVA